MDFNLSLFYTKKSLARLPWKYKVGSRYVDFNDVPFAISESLLLAASMARSITKASDVVAVMTSIPAGSRLMECKAHIEITKYILYPKYQVNTDQTRETSSN